MLSSSFLEDIPLVSYQHFVPSSLASKDIYSRLNIISSILTSGVVHTPMHPHLSSDLCRGVCSRTSIWKVRLVLAESTFSKPLRRWASCLPFEWYNRFCWKRWSLKAEDPFQGSFWHKPWKAPSPYSVISNLPIVLT